MINLTIIGNVGHSAKLQNSKNGEGFYTFTVCVNKGKDKDPQWVDVTLSKKYGDSVAQYITKGTKVYVAGTPSVRGWQSKDGSQINASLSVYATVIELLGSKADGNNTNTESTTSKKNVDADLESDPPF